MDWNKVIPSNLGKVFEEYEEITVERDILSGVIVDRAFGVPGWTRRKLVEVQSLDEAYDRMSEDLHAIERSVFNAIRDRWKRGGDGGEDDNGDLRIACIEKRQERQKELSRSAAACVEGFEVIVISEEGKKSVYYAHGLLGTSWLVRGLLADGIEFEKVRVNELDTGLGAGTAYDKDELRELADNLRRVAEEEEERLAELLEGGKER